MSRIRYVLAGATLLAFAAMSACTVLLDGAPSLGDSCAFLGDDTDCGECLKEECKEEIDACCGGDCGDVLDLVDGCALGDPETCAKLEEAGDDRGGGDDARELRGELASCVSRECDGACPASPSVTSCTAFYDDTCSCTVDEGSPNSEGCDDSRGTCCADAGWPAEGLDCECRPAGCSSSSGYCWCDANGGDERSCNPNLYLYCCRTDDGCECRDSLSCEDLDEVPVSSCTAAEQVCGPGLVSVDHCSATRDDLDD